MQQITNCIDKLKAKFTSVLLSQFDSAIQLYIDNYLGDLLETRIVVEDLAKGIQNVKLNIPYLNKILGTDCIIEAMIGSIQLTSLCLKISGIKIGMQLDKQITREQVYKEQEELAILEEKLQQAARLRSSIFGSTKIEQSVKPKQNSNFQKFIPLLEIINSNPSIRVLDIVISAYWSDNNIGQHISIQQNDLHLQLTKHAENNKIFIQTIIDKFQITYNNSIIGQLDKAVDLKFYIDENIPMKTNCQIGKLAIALDRQQFKTIFKLTQTIQQRQLQRAQYIFEFNQKFVSSQEANMNDCLQLQKKPSVEIYSQSSIFEAGWIKSSQQALPIDCYLDQSIETEQYKAVKELTKMSELIDLNISQMNLDEFLIQANDIIHQKEEVLVNASGFVLAITEDASFDLTYDYNQRFIPSLDSHIVFKIKEIQFNKQHEKLQLMVRKISGYQIIKPDLFMSVDEFQSCASTLKMPQVQIIVKSILQIGQKKQRKVQTILNDCVYQIKEPQLLYNGAKALNIVIQNNKTKIEAAPINLIADSHQVRSFIDILPQSQQNIEIPYEDPQPLKNNIQFRTDISIQYLPLEINEYWTIKCFSVCAQINKLQNQQLINIQLQLDHIFIDKLIQIESVKIQYIAIPTSEIIPKIDHSNTNQYIHQVSQVIPRQIAIYINAIKVQPQDFIAYYQHILQTYLSLFQSGRQNQPQITLPIQQDIMIKLDIQSIQIKYFILQLELTDIVVFKAWIQNIVRIQSIQIIDDDYAQSNDSGLIGYFQKNKEKAKDFFELINTPQSNKIKVRQLVFRLHSIERIMSLKKGIMSQFAQFTLINTQLNQKLEQINTQSNTSLNVKMKSILIDIFPTTPKGVSILTSRIVIQLDKFLLKNDKSKISTLSVMYQDIRSQQPLVQLTDLSDFSSHIYIQEIMFNSQLRKLSVALVSVFNIGVEFIMNIKESANQLLLQIKLQEDLQQKTPLTQDKQTPIANFRVYLREVTITDYLKTFSLNLISTEIHIQDSSINLQFGRFQILDLIKGSKYKYIIDQESVDDYLETEDKENYFGIICINKIDNSTFIHVEIKPIRVCVSGVFLENILNQLEAFKNTNLTQSEEDDDDFEIIGVKEPIKIEAKIAPLLVIVSFDSSGIKPDGILKGILTLGSINNFVLASEGIDFSQNNQYAWENLIDDLIKSFGSTYNLTYKTYQSLGILNPLSEVTGGIHKLINKSIQSGDIVGGFMSLTKGVTSSIISIATLPGKGIAKLGEALGVNVKPIQKLNKKWEELYYKINPEQEIPKRFFK